jgi:hypothetical protein
MIAIVCYRSSVVSTCSSSRWQPVVQVQQSAFHVIGGVEKHQFTLKRAPLVACRWQGGPLCGTLGGGGMELSLVPPTSG